MNGTSSNPLADGIGCGSIWKSPRDRTRSIEATLREFKGNSYADFRVLTSMHRAAWCRPARA
jgi:hypothetical protein